MKTILAPFPNGEKRKLLVSDDANTDALRGKTFHYHTYTNNIRVNASSRRPSQPGSTSIMTLLYGPEYRYARRVSGSDVDFRRQTHMKIKQYQKFDQCRRQVKK